MYEYCIDTCVLHLCGTHDCVCGACTLQALWEERNYKDALNKKVGRVDYKVVRQVRSSSISSTSRRLVNLVELPDCKVVWQEGPAHNRVYDVSSSFGGFVTRGRGPTVKGAEQLAAKAMLELLGGKAPTLT